MSGSTTCHASATNWRNGILQECLIDRCHERGETRERDHAERLRLFDTPDHLRHGINEVSHLAHLADIEVLMIQKFVQHRPQHSQLFRNAERVRIALIRRDLFTDGSVILQRVPTTALAMHEEMRTVDAPAMPLTAAATDVVGPTPCALLAVVPPPAVPCSTVPRWLKLPDVFGRDGLVEGRIDDDERGRFTHPRSSGAKTLITRQSLLEQRIQRRLSGACE
jgi:hypothetical protein